MNKFQEFIKYNSLNFAFFFYEFIIAIRIFAEMDDLTVPVFVHQLFWFNCVMICFFFCFKQLLKVEPEKLWILAGGSFLAFIPLIYSIYVGKLWGLNYIKPETMSQIVKDVATLLYKHPYNWPMFPELLALLICSTIVGIIISKTFFKSFFTSLTALYVSFFILGFSWISVNSEHPSLFLLKTTFKEQQFYALQMITIFSVTAFVTYFTEFTEIFKRVKYSFYFTLSLIVSVLSFQGLFLFFFTKQIYPADIIVSFIPLTVIILTGGSFIKPEWRNNAIIPLAVSILTIAVLIWT